MTTRLILPTLLLLAATPAASQRDQEAYDFYQQVSAAAEACREPRPRIGGEHVPMPHRWALRLLEWMLHVDPARCPGVPEAAARMIPERIGSVETGRFSLDYLRLAWEAAENGLGRPRDEALADAYGRLLWLFDDEPPTLPRWSEAERQAWLARPEAASLLRARNDIPHAGTRRSLALEGELRLRRDLPAIYDPQRAVRLFADSSLLFDIPNRLRLSRLLTEGDHVPPDYPAAAQPFLTFIGWGNGAVAEADRELLRIGRLAAASARAPQQRAEAIRILWAAAVDADAPGRETLNRMLRPLRRAPRVPLAAGDAKRIAAIEDEVTASIALDGDPEAFRPVLLRALLGPDGRVAFAEVAESSGAPRRDRIALGGWAENNEEVDLSASAGGRFVWVDLPPLDVAPD
jgi:hypothetical protein